MKVANVEIELNTNGEFDPVDITEQVCGAVTNSGVKNGVVIIASQHTTAAVVINEFESGFFQDLKIALQKLAPKELHYYHNDMHVRNAPPGEPKNGHSHILASLIGSSQTVPVVDGQLKLGTWQSIFLVELDFARYRRVIVTVIGE